MKNRNCIKILLDLNDHLLNSQLQKGNLLKPYSKLNFKKFSAIEEHFHQQEPACGGAGRNWGATRRRQKKKNKTVQVSLEGEKRRSSLSVRLHGDVWGAAQVDVLVFAGGDVVGGVGGACVGGGQSGFSDLVLSLVEQDVGGVGLRDRKSSLSTSLSQQQKAPSTISAEVRGQVKMAVTPPLPASTQKWG